MRRLIDAFLQSLLTDVSSLLCRYYYDGDMISKVHGKRFVYKFVCDLRQLIGYSAAELNRLVTEAEEKALAGQRINKRRRRR